MSATAIYILLFAIGAVTYGYYMYRSILSKRLQKEDRKSNGWKLAYLTICMPLLVIPAMYLVDKWLSPYIANETGIFCCQIMAIVIVVSLIGIPARWLANRQDPSKK